MFNSRDHGTGMAPGSMRTRAGRVKVDVTISGSGLAAARHSMGRKAKRTRQQMGEAGAPKNVCGARPAIAPVPTPERRSA